MALTSQKIKKLFNIPKHLHVIFFRTSNVLGISLSQRMQVSQKKNSTDVIILFESSAMIGSCFESILDNYLKPLLQYY